jgi:hypothetical protein
MACLMWRYRDETGCLDFLQKQMVGRDCFPGSPQVLPTKYFDLYLDRYRWLVWLHESPEFAWNTVELKQPDSEWSKLGDSPILIQDGTLFKLGISDHSPQMVFRLQTCCDATEIRSFWDMPVWGNSDPDESPAPSLSEIPGPARHAAKGLVWLAWFLGRYQWAAVGAIALLSAGLFSLSTGYITINQNNNDSKDLRD